MKSAPEYITDLVVLFDDSFVCVGVIPISPHEDCELFWNQCIGKPIEEIVLDDKDGKVKLCMNEALIHGTSKAIVIKTYHSDRICASRGEFRFIYQPLMGKKILAWYQYSTWLSQEIDFHDDLNSFIKLIQGLAVPMFIIEPIELKLISSNIQTRELLGLNKGREKLSNLEDISGLDKNQLREIINNIIEKGHNIVHHKQYFPDSTSKDLEIHISHINLSGKTILTGLIFDITEKLEKEKKLKQNLKLFQSLFENNTLPIVLIDSKYLNITASNHRACDFFGLDESELNGTPLASFSNMNSKKFNSIIKDFMGKKYTGLELPLKTKNKGVRDVAINYTTAEVENYMYYLVILIDVTERNNALKTVARVKEGLSEEVRKQTSDLVNANQSLLEQIRERERVEIKLKHSEQIFQKLFLIDPNGMVLKPASSGKVTEVNESFQRIFNIKKGKVLVNKIENLPIHYNIENYLKNYDKLINERSIYNIPMTMHCSRGHVKYILYSGEVIKHEKGDYILEIFQDITNIQIAQQKLLESEEQYRSMFNNALVGFYRTEIETGIVLNINLHFARILGYKNESELIGQSLLQHYQKDSDLNEFIEVLKKDKSVVFENALKSKDGKTVWVVNFARIYPEKGYIEGVAVDITDRKIMEDMLQYSENRFRSMIENASDIILIVDIQGKILYNSPSLIKQLGYNATKNRDANIFNFLDAEDQEIMRKVLRSKTRSKRINEIKVRHKKGSYRIFEFTVTNLITDPSVGGIIINARDISNLIKARNEIDNALKREQELNRQKSQFISTVSHEFRTPLTNMSLNTQLLDKYLQTGKFDKANESLVRMTNATKRLTALLNEVSLISKDQSGRLQFSPEIIDVHLLIDELIDQQSYLFLPYVEVSVSKNEPTDVMADKTLLSHILGNLVSNAVKYSPNKSDVSVRIEHKNQMLEIYVKDKGIGIPESELNFLFNPYFRASNVKNIEGTGLGLSIVKRCVELHNGTIKIKSKVGKGTEVRCTIPITV